MTGSTSSPSRSAPAITVSRDAGATWTDVSPETYYGHYSLLVLRNTPRTVYARGTGLYRSTDGGDSWQKLTDTSLYKIVASPDDERIMYSTNRLVTHDGGISWESMGNGLPDKGMHQIVVDSVATHILYASFGLYASPCVGVYVSLDAGQHWQSMNAGLGNRCVGGLALSPASEYLYAAGEDGIWRYSLDTFRTP